MSPGAFWPWWLGAVCLAVVAVGCCVVCRRPLGVSGVLARFVGLRRELEAERRRRVMDADAAALEAALLAATAEAFGPAGAAPAAQAAATADARASGRARRGCVGCGAAESRPSIGIHAVFLVAIVLGGLAARLARGGWRPTLDMGPVFTSFFGSGPLAVLVLAAGGLLVGVGTTVSGGCSMGHGLSGTSRLQPASVAATVTFFGAAVAVSFLLEGVVRP